MNARHCEQEQAVLDAVRSGGWTDTALERHAASCPVCADVALVARYLARQEASSTPETALPHPGLIWWKAQIMARRDAAERAAAPIAIAERVAAACGIVVLLAAVLWQWPRLYAWVLRHAASADLGSGLSNAVVLMSVAACLALAAFVLYIVWAEE
jgi:hypothetical protein